MSKPSSRSKQGDSAQPVLDQLAESLRPIELSETRRSALFERVLQRARITAPEGTVTYRGSARDWVQVAPFVEARLLNVDAATGTHISLLRMQAGGAIPRHRHGSDEEFIVLEGECHVGEQLLLAGDVHCAAAGSVHGPITTATHVLVYLRGEYPYPRGAVE
jgi:quercetin dioxygenase-like cupin family protein